jgi:hypothetical protein
LHLDVFGEALVAPVLAHFGVEKILVDRGEFFAKSFVELLEYFGVAFHAEKDAGNGKRCKERKRILRENADGTVAYLGVLPQSSQRRCGQRRKWEMSQRMRVRPTLRAMEVVIGK